MRHLRLLLFTGLIILAATSAVPAATDNAVGSALPPKVKFLLIREMNAILDASQTIIDALVRGDDEKVAQNAQAIHDSFIMKQEMTNEDRKALLNTVSDEFIKRDEAFHELCARLAEAARYGAKHRQEQLFTQMVAACTECHARHATDRFPALAGRD